MASPSPAPAGPNRFGRPGVRILTAVLVVLSLWTLSGFVGQLLTSAQTARNQAEVRAEVAQIATENAVLATQVAEAQSPAYAERILREQRGYAREGDTVILPSFPQTTPTSAQPTVAPAPAPTPAPNWQRWMRALFPLESDTE